MTYHADWTAGSSNGLNQRLSDSITLPPGVYVIRAALPVLSATPYYATIANVPMFSQLVGFNCASACTIAKLTTTTEIYIFSGQSTSCTFTYLERGSLDALRIA